MTLPEFLQQDDADTLQQAAAIMRRLLDAGAELVRTLANKPSLSPSCATARGRRS